MDNWHFVELAKLTNGSAGILWLTLVLLSLLALSAFGGFGLVFALVYLATGFFESLQETIETMAGAPCSSPTELDLGPI